MKLELASASSGCSSMSPRCKSAYFTEADCEVLLLCYEQYKGIITKKSNTAAAAKERQWAWQKVTDRVNACSSSGTRRTVDQVKMKYKNLLQRANRKKAEARQAGGGLQPPSLTPSEELALSLNEGRPVVDGILHDTLSDTPSCDRKDVVEYTDGELELDPSEIHSVTCDDDMEAMSAVTEQDDADTHIETFAGDVNADGGPSTSSHSVSCLPVKELYKVHLQKKIIKSDMEVDLLQLHIEKAKLEIEILRHRLKEMIE